jgi:hypothetical protein
MMKKVLLLLAAVLMLVTGCSKSAVTPTPPANAESNYNCSVSQGFNFQKDAQELVGHINYLKIGDTELAADMGVTDPVDPTRLVKVVAVVSGAFWNGGYADPLQFISRISTDNKNVVANLMHKSLSNTDVEISFTVYDYDPKEKKYFQCFYSNNVRLKGLVYKTGGESALQVDMDQSVEVQSPKNYTLSIGIMPQDIAQEIYLAVSTNNKFIKRWGVSVAQ